MQLIREIDDGKKIKSYRDVASYLEEFKNQDREMFIVLGLDTRNKVTYREIVAIGTLNGTIMHPREVFKKAIMLSCNSIICSHNHPSGDVEPSEEDIQITDRLRKAGEIIGINLLDHVILGKDQTYSFNENDWR